MPLEAIPTWKWSKSAVKNFDPDTVQALLFGPRIQELIKQYNLSETNVVLEDCEFTHNQALLGGALYILGFDVFRLTQLLPE